MTAENTPAAKQSWWCWAGQDVAGCDLGRQGESSSCQSYSPAPRQDQLSPCWVCGRFLSPPGMEVILTPGGYYSQKELVLPLKLQPLVSHSPQKSPFLPARSLHLRDIPPPSPGDGWLQPGNHPKAWQTPLTLASFHCSFPTPLQCGTQNRTYSQG